MPGIPEGGVTTQTITNLGNTTISVKYNKNVKTKSTFTVRATDTEESLPNVGSKVLVWFLEGNIRYAFWKKFNVKGDYEVIDEEKYPRVFYITVNGQQFEVNEDDKIELKLPDNYKIVKSQADKTKTFTIEPVSDLEERVKILENNIGHPVQHTTDSNGAAETVEPTGIYKMIVNLNSRLSYLESLLENEKSSTSSTN